MSEFESAAQLTVLAEPNSDTDNSSGLYSQTGDGDFVWFTSQTSTPAVRLITGSFEAGCTDEGACNYDPSAGVSDASCLFVGEPCNDGLVITINDVVTENCQCEGEGAVYGCTDPAACNYDAEAILTICRVARATGITSLQDNHCTSKILNPLMMATPLQKSLRYLSFGLPQERWTPLFRMKRHCQAVTP